ncbi:MAG: hypothetical protein RMJ89_13275 [Flammeovirgaceae bacterium]|nr:hypothetical protein [Flammeovirgaceae bacterium]
MYDTLEAVSWAEKTQYLIEWVSNHMQKDAIKKLYQLEKKVVASQNPSFLETWRNLQAHQHLFYMQTKIHSNHQILSNPFQTPFDAYISFMNILSDFELVVA